MQQQQIPGRVDTILDAEVQVKLCQLAQAPGSSICALEACELPSVLTTRQGMAEPHCCQIRRKTMAQQYSTCRQPFSRGVADGTLTYSSDRTADLRRGAQAQAGLAPEVAHRLW